MADIFVIIVVAAVLCYAGSFVATVRRRRAETTFRRDSLRYDAATQQYHWQTIDGRTHSADSHPDRPGGIWYEAEMDAMRDTRS